VLHNLLQFGFAGFAGIYLLGAFLRRAHRGSFFAAAICAGSAAIAAHYDVFWALAVFGMGSVWALFTATNLIDLGWRVKTGFVLFLAMGAALCIYPTYYDETHPVAHPAPERSPQVGEAAPPPGPSSGPTITPAPPADKGSAKSDQLSEEETRARHGGPGVGLGRFLRANIPFRLVRGLDLKGGLRLVYTVGVEAAVKDKLDRYYDEIRASLCTALGFHSGDKAPTVAELAHLPEKVEVVPPKEQSNQIVLRFKDIADAKKVNDDFLKRFLGELQLQRAPDGKTLTFRLRSERETDIRDKAVNQAKETVHRRIDELGVKEPSLTVRDEDIIIEVPGDDDKEFAKMRELIGEVARLEFKMVDDDVDFFEKPAAAKGEDQPKNISFQMENAHVGKGPGGEIKTKANHFARITRLEHEPMEDALNRLKEWVRTLPIDPDHEIGYEKLNDYVEERDEWEDVGWRTYYLFSKAEITGDMVREAQAVPDEGGRGLGGWRVQMDLTPVGGDRFEEITGRNVQRRFAIILDNKVESAPVIQTKIPGGHAVITMGAGNPDQQLHNAKKLEMVLKSGALPAPISRTYEQRIGASLGRDAIVQAGKGAIAGGILVLLFMVTYYSRAGMIANIAVVFNLILQIAILAMLGASMTLPGMAGLTLTMGIAVDANVLINERIREELRHGKSPRAAVDVGYDKAFSAIIDGHATTLIAGIILAQYGTGPIKGFAVTLFIGVLASLFTGVVCTRLMFDWAVRGRKVKSLYLG
jgi:preprotein translocase subunit SecD